MFLNFSCLVSSCLSSQIFCANFLFMLNIRITTTKRNRQTLGVDSRSLSQSFAFALFSLWKTEQRDSSRFLVSVSFSHSSISDIAPAVETGIVKHPEWAGGHSRPQRNITVWRARIFLNALWWQRPAHGWIWNGITGRITDAGRREKVKVEKKFKKKERERRFRGTILVSLQTTSTLLVLSLLLAFTTSIFKLFYLLLFRSRFFIHHSKYTVYIIRNGISVMYLPEIHWGYWVRWNKIIKWFYSPLNLYFCFKPLESLFLVSTRYVLVTKVFAEEEKHGKMSKLMKLFRSLR